MIAVLLALLASVAWGTSDFLAGVESRRTTFWAAVLISQPAALAGALIALAVHGQGPPTLSSLAAPLLAGFASALAAFAQYRALVLVPMSLVSPLLGAATLVPVLWGVARGERPSIVQTAGMVLALLGIVLISLRERVPTARAAPLVPADPAPSASKAAGPDRARSAAVCALPAGMTPERARQLGVLLALGAGLGFGLLLVAFDYGGSADEYWTVTAARSTAVLTVLTLIGVNRPRLHLRRSSVPILVAVGLLLAGANVLFTTASTRGYLSVVAVLGGLSPAFTVGYAQAFLHEDMRSLQWFAAGLVFAGVICLAAG